MSRSQHKMQRLRRQVTTRQDPCYRCGQTIDYSLPTGHPDSFTLEHKQPVKLRPDLLYDPANCTASHQKCNYSAKDKPSRVIATYTNTW